MARTINYTYTPQETWILREAMRGYVDHLKSEFNDDRDVYDVSAWTIYPEALLMAVYMVKEFNKDLHDMGIQGLMAESSLSEGIMDPKRNM